MTGIAQYQNKSRKKLFHLIKKNNILTRLVNTPVLKFQGFRVKSMPIKKPIIHDGLLVVLLLYSR